MKPRDCPLANRELGVQGSSLVQSSVCLTIRIMSIYPDTFTIQVSLFVMIPRATNFAHWLVTLGSSGKWYFGHKTSGL